MLTLTLCACTTKQEISYNEAKNLIQEGAIIVDVRTTTEYKAKHIKNAISIPVENINKEIKEKNTPIILYCQSGTRSKEAQKILTDLGYTKVYNLGSIDKWKQ